jgi:ubiquinone/menaquinone biosynthesis C-methylase UbiE
MNEKWIYSQTEQNVQQWDNTMEHYYPESSVWLRDSKKYYERLCEQCNYLDAVKLINIEMYMQTNSRVLDMACGGGWLTGYLANFDKVEVVYAMDSSMHFLDNILPEIVNIMGPHKEKVKTIQGLFTPLLLEDESMDVVVASSALHHAENLESVLYEVRRVLKPNGVLLILNETPNSYLRFVLAATFSFMKIFYKILLKNYVKISPSISASGYLNNPYLGDKSYPLWYWKEAIIRAGFRIQDIVNTNLPTVKNTKSMGLTHFVCKPDLR